MLLILPGYICVLVAGQSAAGVVGAPCPRLCVCLAAVQDCADYGHTVVRIILTAAKLHVHRFVRVQRQVSILLLPGVSEASSMMRHSHVVAGC